jgi:hypothetical protein
MFDTTIHAKTLARHLLASDFHNDPTLKDPINRAQLLHRGAQIGANGYAGLVLKKSRLRGNWVYQFNDLADALVARQITANVRRVTSVKQDDRQFIVQCIKSLCEEGVPFWVHKYDIRKFYESIPVNDLLGRLRMDIAFSGQSSRVLDTLFAELSGQGIQGLPRGLAISATLSEYLMRDFDNKVSGLPGVWFYARFVDDIFIMTSPRGDASAFDKSVTEVLPNGLVFNEKSDLIEFAGFQKGNNKPDLEHKFGFLGYSFSVSKAHRDPGRNKILRRVEADISENKVKRLKTRVAKSLLEFRATGNYGDLRDRIRLLTSNFSFDDFSTGDRRTSGIFFNYPLVDAGTSESLPVLDVYLRGVIASPSPKNKLRPTLSHAQQRELLRLTFTGGFVKKRFFHFPPARLESLKACWTYA